MIRATINGEFEISDRSLDRRSRKKAPGSMIRATMHRHQ